MTTTSYDPATGLPVTVAAAGKTLTTAYDNLGRIISYTDATGVAATSTYDLAGRVATSNDGKGTITITYDTATEHCGSDFGEGGAWSSRSGKHQLISRHTTS